VDTETIETEEWIQKFKVWKVSTTTSPSGIHLGHYKPLISPHHEHGLDQQQQEIGDFHAQFLNTVLTAG
jgi:hypothetical protein